MSLHRFWLSAPLLLIALLVSCDRADPLGPPVLEAARAGSGTSPSAPSNANAVAVSENRIDVSWQDNSGNETGFELHRSSTGPSGVYALLVQTVANVTGYSNVGLKSVTQYCYKVRALRTTRSKTSYSEFSSPACATTPAPPPPVAPSAADVGPLNSTAVVLTWTDNSTNEEGFRIERSLDAGASWSVAGTQAAPDFVDSGLASEQPVCYRVIAFNAGGDSPSSNTDCTTPPAGPTDLTAIVAYNAETDEFEVELTWTDNSLVEDGYLVGVSGCCSRAQFWFSLPPNSTTFRYVLVDPEEYIDVAASKDGGNSDFSSVTVTAPSSSDPAGATAGGTFLRNHMAGNMVKGR